MNIRQFCAKFGKKPNKFKKNSKTYSYIWHFDKLVLKISEILVEIQQFRHEWSSKMYKNTQKNSKKQWNQMAFYNLLSHLECRYIIKTCVLIGQIFCESLMKIHATKRKCRTFLWYMFFRHKAVFPSRVSRSENYRLRQQTDISKIRPKRFYIRFI